MIMESLPGTKAPYLLRSGMGHRYLGGGQVASLIARNEDTDGLLEAVVVSGGCCAEFPPHRHIRTHETLYVLDGQIALNINGSETVLSRGDYASIPPETVHGYRMLDHYTRLLFWTVNGNTATLHSTLGTPFQGHVRPEGPPEPFTPDRLEAAQELADIRFENDSTPVVSEPTPKIGQPPAGNTPYILRSGEGERMIAGDQLFAFLAHGGNTDGKFICLTMIGPKGERIPEHFHERHTETFLCLDGIMTMWADGGEAQLLPGDFLHVPAGTIHAYRLDAPFTRFIGMLSPGIFEPFFRTMCDPYDGFIFPQSPKPVRFDRVMQRLGELDLKLVGPPRQA